MRPRQHGSASTAHDTSDVVSGSNALPSSSVFGKPDTERGLRLGFSRDPFDAKHLMQTLDEIMKADVAEKASVTDYQRRLLESRYGLQSHSGSARSHVTRQAFGGSAYGPTQLAEP